jgi:hypothetical protein
VRAGRPVQKNSGMHLCIPEPFSFNLTEECYLFFFFGFAFALAFAFGFAFFLAAILFSSQTS